MRPENSARSPGMLPSSIFRRPPASDLRARAMTHESVDDDIVCFSHLRWDFVFQRPQHLLTRFARNHKVFFFEEALPSESGRNFLDVSPRPEGVTVVTPRMRPGMTHEEANLDLERLTSQLLSSKVSPRHIFWYYTPLALQYTRRFSPRLTVYDCMDELSGFLGAHELLPILERELMGRSDLVFTGGHSLYDAKRHLHRNIHALPSSIDRAHFSRAQEVISDPFDQQDLPHPRAGFYGVIDERLDRELLGAIAKLLPNWQFIMIGPVVKIKRGDLPELPNIHYLGSKPYQDLPLYLGQWDVAIMPFARNSATRFISPTKTPEYLAGGAPVVSTPITDVIEPYGNTGLAHIAETPQGFAAALERAKTQRSDVNWKKAVDRFLSATSWDRTWGNAYRLMLEAYEARWRPAATSIDSHQLQR